MLLLEVADLEFSPDEECFKANGLDFNNETLLGLNSDIDAKNIILVINKSDRLKSSTPLTQRDLTCNSVIKIGKTSLKPVAIISCTESSNIDVLLEKIEAKVKYSYI